MSEIGTDDFCPACGDSFSDHVLVATDGNPLHGGTMYCPVPDCPCSSTWSVKGLPEGMREK